MGNARTTAWSRTGDRTPVTFLTGALVALVVMLLADALLTWWVRREAAARLENALGVPVEIDVRGWPAALRLPLGRLRSVILRADEVPVGRTTLRELEVELDGVRPRITRDGGWRAATRGGSFTARLDPDGFRALAPLPSEVLDVRFVPSQIRFRLPGGVAVPASVSVEDDLVVLAPEISRLEVLSVLRFAFPLEELPFGASVREVEVVEGALLVRGTVGALELGD